MKNKSIVLSVLGLLVSVVILFVVTKSRISPPITQTGETYCSSEGTLTDTMPIQSHRSYCLKSDSIGKTYPVNIPTEYSFSIVDDQGNTLTNFETTHTKLMHLIVARKDLAYFQHLHPTFNPATGEFKLSDLTFSADGVYRVFADFAPSGGQKDHAGAPLPVTLSLDVSVGVGVDYTSVALGSLERVKTFDGYLVTLATDQNVIVSGKETMVTFDINQNNQSVTNLEPYLGALGHSVVLHQGNLNFIHAHPVEDVSKLQTGKVNFMVNFPEAGKYKIFSQFQRNGKVFTTDFVVDVAQGQSAQSEGKMMH